MHKIWTVARYELISTLTRRSFILTTLGIPLITIGTIALMMGMFNSDEQPATPVSGEAPPADVNEAGADLADFEPATEVYGYVDQAGLIATLPDDVPADTLVAYPDESSAAAALEAGAITGYYLIPADYLAEGQLIYIDPDFNAARINEQARVMRWTLFVNLAGGNTPAAARALRPMDVQPSPIMAETPVDSPPGDDCSRPGFDCESNAFVRYLSGIVMLVLYMCILMSSSLLLNSVGEEKKNRLVEMMLVTISSRQMLTGKIIGLGIAALIQIAAWVAMGYVTLRLGGSAIDLPPDFVLPAEIVVWSVVFFILGYAMYASLLAGLGALAPDVRKVSGAIFVIIIPLLMSQLPLPEILDDVLNLGGGLEEAATVFFSIFPLSAPTAMIERIVNGPVPVWQPLLATGLMILTAIFIVRAVARMFRAQVLLSGQPFSVGRYFAVLFDRA